MSPHLPDDWLEKQLREAGVDEAAIPELVELAETEGAELRRKYRAGETHGGAGLVARLRELEPAELRRIAKLWEEARGSDSIDTVEGYEHTERGAIICVWPRCRFVRHDPVEVWFHVHFADKHDPLDQGPEWRSWPELAAILDAAGR